MERIAIISDVHGNITALNTVLEDINSRGIYRIFCLGDSVTKCANPDLVIDKLREKCEIMIKGNCDDIICQPTENAKRFWSRKKIGEERANYIYNLPVCYDFYMSGRLVRLFHASPQSLFHIYNPMFSNEGNSYADLELKDPMNLFENTDFIEKSKDSPIPDVVGYGHIHTPNIFRFKNKLIFNTGSVGIPVEMENTKTIDNTSQFSTLSSYIILEGEYDSKELSSFSVTLVRLPYNIQKEIDYLNESDMPGKENLICSLQTACS